MKSYILTFLALATFSFASSAFASMKCWINVSSDLKNPMVFDKTLWQGTFESAPLHFLIAKDRSALIVITEAQSFDQKFLSQHEGEFAVAIGKPYPNDKVAGDILLALSTIDTTQPDNRTDWTDSVGKIDQSSADGYGILINDFTRHIAVNCR